MAFEMQDFRRDVVEASRTKPVVVDFWADWCGPCKVLGPVLEKLASEAKGRWSLVKIDTEKHPQLAAQFGIRSIPAVKMVYQGAIVAEFVGAQPEAQIRRWLEQHLPASEEEVDVEKHLQELLAEGDRLAAREIVAEQYAADPASKELAAQLAVLSLPDRVEDARILLQAFKDEPRFEIEAETVLFFEHARSLSSDIPLEGKPAAVQSYREGIAGLVEGDYGKALSSLIDSMVLDRSVDNDGARRGCVAIFRLLGDAHPISKAWRRRFSMALY